jgi:hypothetical protein
LREKNFANLFLVLHCDEQAGTPERLRCGCPLTFFAARVAVRLPASAVECFTVALYSSFILFRNGNSPKSGCVRA